MAAKKVLGRGLEALIPRAGATPRGAQELAVSALRPNPRQPRRRFGRDELAELAASIREHGVLQPLLVRPAAGGYEVVAGERRLLAAREAGLKAVPCVVRDVPDEFLLPLALVENLQRDDLNAVEAANGFKQMAAEFGFSHEAIARAVGKSRAAVSNAIRLLELSPPIVEMLAAGELTAGQARPLLGVTPPARQRHFARRIINQGLSARQVEAMVARVMRQRPAGEKKRPGRRQAPYVDAVVRRLEEKLGTKVTMKGTAKSGTINIHYFSAEDRERLIDALAGEKA